MLCTGKLRATKHDIVETYFPLFKNSARFLNNDLTPQEADSLIAEGVIDGAVFGWVWIGTPDVVRRLEQRKIKAVSDSVASGEGEVLHEYARKDRIYCTPVGSV